MYSLSLKNCFVRQNLYLSTGIMRARTIKHKKSPWFCIHVDDRMLMKLKYCQVQSYCVSHSHLSQNPGPSYQCSDKYARLAAHGVSEGNSVSLLETRLSDLNRTAFDVGGGGDCFFRAVSHQLYGNPNYHTHVRSLGIQYLLQNPEQFIESNTENSRQGYLNNISCPRTWVMPL